MVLEKARELGLALSASEEFQRMNNARIVLRANVEVSGILQIFQSKKEELVSLLSKDNPDRMQITVLSNEVDALQEQLLHNPVFAEAMESQNEFQNLMNLINKEIGAYIGMQAEEDMCGGSCEGCTACQH